MDYTGNLIKFDRQKVAEIARPWTHRTESVNAVHNTILIAWSLTLNPGVVYCVLQFVMPGLLLQDQAESFKLNVSLVTVENNSATFCRSNFSRVDYKTQFFGAGRFWVPFYIEITPAKGFWKIRPSSQLPRRICVCMELYSKNLAKISYYITMTKQNFSI